MTDWRPDIDVQEGDRVRLVSYALDDGLRIWPIQDERDAWRVVRVQGGELVEELMRGSQLECQTKHPDAVWSINDNESVPPGTEGTVDVADKLNLKVNWDNGRRLGVTAGDVIEKL